MFREWSAADFPKPFFVISGMERSGFPETIFRYFGNGAQRISRNNFSLFREWSAADFPKQLFVISGMERSGFPETTFRYFGNGAQRISRNNFSGQF
ncbi:hypothetical protein PN36_05420 [Candidatus Thiomargarita nelsonii]|uniref:Uncharacterized protein n=1 Tax=Candidatus Thiomargarita nelsonii TaxID=1003181 RepID=A0A4E0QSF3_9GAMM|nr:hypothetical protein PN36_05420 [Candidatus Thiomargarita nelsonii]